MFNYFNIWSSLNFYLQIRSVTNFNSLSNNFRGLFVRHQIGTIKIIFPSGNNHLPLPVLKPVPLPTFSIFIHRVTPNVASSSFPTSSFLIFKLYVLTLLSYPKSFLPPRKATSLIQVLINHLANIYPKQNDFSIKKEVVHLDCLS